MKSFLSRSRLLTIPALFCTGLGLISWATAVLWRGSAAATFDYLDGKVVHAQPTTGPFSIASNTDTIVRFSLTNLSSHPIEIVGGASTCSCLIANNLPLTIDASSSRAVDLTVHGIKAGPFSQVIELYTNSSEQPVVTLNVKGEITSP